MYVDSHELPAKGPAASSRFFLVKWRQWIGMDLVGEVAKRLQWRKRVRNNVHYYVGEWATKRLLHFRRA